MANSQTQQSSNILNFLKNDTFIFNLLLGFVLAIISGLITSPVDKAIYTAIACFVGTIINILHFYVNKYILKISNLGSYLASLFTLILSLGFLSIFLLLSGISSVLIINLLVSASIGLTSPIIINYFLMKTSQELITDNLNWRQIILSLYFWVYTGISCFGENIFGEGKAGIIFPLVFGGCAFVIFGLTLVGTLFASDTSKLKNPSTFLHTFFIIFLMLIITFIFLYYIFQVNLKTMYPFLFGWLTIIIVYAFSLLKNKIVESTNRSPLYYQFLQMIFTVILLGGIIILVNRLNGAYGLVLCGLSLLVGGTYIFGVKKLFFIDKVLILGAGIMVSRAVLQLYLERTNLTSYGIDITTAYTFGLLVIGMAMPLILSLCTVLSLNKKLIAFFLCLLIINLPLITGFFVHTTAVSSFIFGFLSISLIIGAILTLVYENKWITDNNIQLILMKTNNLLIPLIIVCTGITILSASFVIYVSDMTRLERVLIFVGFLIIACLVSFFSIRVKKSSVSK